MKKILFLISFCTSIIGIAQNLERKIPQNSKSVVSINGNHLLDLISITEFNDLDISKEFFRRVSGKTHSTITSLKDFGFDINSKAYFFRQTIDSVSYESLLIKLSDKKLFENFFSTWERKKIEHNKNLNILNEYGGWFMVWNDNMLLLTTGNQSLEYYINNEERFLKQELSRREFTYEIEIKIYNWVRNYALTIFNSNNSKSILNNSSYIKVKDKKAVASFWTDNYGEGIKDVNQYLMSLLSPEIGFSKNKFKVEGDAWVNLYFEDEVARLTVDIEINNEWKNNYKKMYKAKIGNEFFNYFDQDNVLAYTSLSFDMQTVLEEYPLVISNIYSIVEPKYKEEANVASELFSVLLDEEAIGDVITGNMLFVLNNINEKEVAYTSYGYDDNDNRIEVIKTKIKPVPDFTIMIGSKNRKLLNKLIRLGVKYKFISPKANYFKVKKENDVPFDLFFAIKNDIAFLTTSEKQISDIVNDKIISSIGKHKKLIRNNTSVLYANGKQIMHKIPNLKLNKNAAKIFDYANENFNETYFTISRMNGNRISMELKIDTPKKHGNSLKFLLNSWDFFNKL